MKVRLDENKHFTGDYCTIGDLPDSVEADSLPNEADRDKLLSYRLIDGEWFFDEEYYRKIIAEKEHEEQRRQNQQAIDNLKQELQSTDYQVIKCMEASLNGEELPYDVSLLHAERQVIRNKINELEAELETIEEREDTMDAE